MKKPHVYMAAGWFDKEQIKQYEEVYSVLKSLEKNKKIDLFAPKYDGIVLKKEDPDREKKMDIVFWLDVEMLKRSDLIVACTVNKDTGTAVECGMGIILQKKIICYNSVPEHGLNIMLAKPASAFVKNEKDLKNAVISFLESYENDELASWVYNKWTGEPI